MPLSGFTPSKIKALNSPITYSISSVYKFGYIEPFASIDPSTGEITLSENAPLATTEVSVFAKDSTGFEYYQNYTLVGKPKPQPKPPMFTVKMKNYYSMKIGSNFELGLPLLVNEGIEISHNSIPSFATIDKFYYTFIPTTIAHIGIFLIKGSLKNA